MESTIADAFREFGITRLPADLLAELEVTIEDGDFQINVELRRTRRRPNSSVSTPSSAPLTRSSGVG
jgi:hypothetical protein